MVLIVAVVLMAILPDLVQYLSVGHVPETDRVMPPRISPSKAAIAATYGALLLVCAVLVLMRGYSGRKIAALSILLLGVIFPYIVPPVWPGTADAIRVAVAAAVTVAAWNIGAPVGGLKWLSITGSLIGASAIVAGLIIPEHAMYMKGSSTTIIMGWQLAGPFAHSNVLGIYCVLALAFTPLIVTLRWRITHGLILCAAIMASASRTALVAVGVLVLWWIVCRFRSVISVRLAGTVLVGVCTATMVVVPFLSWKGVAFTGKALSGRGHIWATCLSAWDDSPIVGLGVDWFKRSENIWSMLGGFIPPHGHNLVVDTLVRSGLVGVCIVGLVLLAATHAIRAFDVSRDQIACFGYLIMFLFVSITEAIWLLPNMQLFPVVGLAIAVVIVARSDVQEPAAEQPPLGADGVEQN
ncbi:O-antigen ligase [Mycobacterium sp. 3519A]|uniref:O-antigen ligase family protein n=1 Tax=Mycobacterium sp. 3519A TaxID=2057184 RepID=UPI0013587861|nr:O-antigen ligase family protein [Mycobacterium sp. 3519A]